MLGLLKQTSSRRGNKNFTNFSCLFPIYIEATKANEVTKEEIGIWFIGQGK